MGCLASAPAFGGAPRLAPPVQPHPGDPHSLSLPQRAWGFDQRSPEGTAHSTAPCRAAGPGGIYLAPRVLASDTFCTAQRLQEAEQRFKVMVLLPAFLSQPHPSLSCVGLAHGSFWSRHPAFKAQPFGEQLKAASQQQPVPWRGAAEPHPRDALPSPEAQGAFGVRMQPSAVSQGDKATACACPWEAAREDCFFSSNRGVDGGDVEKGCSSSRQGPPGPVLKSARRGGSRRILHKSPSTTSVGLRLKQGPQGKGCREAEAPHGRCGNAEAAQEGAQLHRRSQHFQSRQPRVAWRAPPGANAKTSPVPCSACTRPSHPCPGAVPWVPTLASRMLVSTRATPWFSLKSWILLTLLNSDSTVVRLVLRSMTWLMPCRGPTSSVVAGCFSSWPHGERETDRWTEVNKGIHGQGSDVRSLAGGRGGWQGAAGEAGARPPPRASVQSRQRRARAVQVSSPELTVPMKYSSLLVSLQQSESVVTNLPDLTPPRREGSRGGSEGANAF